MIDWLSGKKSYITAGTGAVLYFATQMGWMSQDQFNKALEGLAVLLAFFLRAAITKSGPE